jgi:hypothetical protein
MKPHAALSGLLALLVAIGVDARDLSAADFDWRATLITDRSEGLHQLQLGQEALLAATESGVRDLRIFNANGEALPVAQLPAVPPAAAEHGAPVELHMAPLPNSPQAQERALAEYALRWVRDRDRTTLEIGTGALKPDQAREPGGYLLDLRPLKDKQGELLLHFAADAPDYANTATISGSDDLVSWHPLASGPLARNRRLGDAVVERSTFDLRHPPAFARVQWPAGAAPKLDGASFREQLPAPVAPTLHTPLELAALQDARWLIDVPVGLPLTRIMIRVAQPNQALRVDVLCPPYGTVLPDRSHLLRDLSNRTSPEPWLACARNIEVFRADRAGEWVENAPIAIPGRPTRLLLQVVEPRDYRGQAPSVEAEWMPVRLAFLARAPGPYQLAVGHEGAEQGPRLDLVGMLPREDPAGARLPFAQVAQIAPASAAQAATRATRLARSQARWRWSLWAVLLLAVVALAALAWRLARNIHSTSG